MLERESSVCLESPLVRDLHAAVLEGDWSQVCVCTCVDMCTCVQQISVDMCACAHVCIRTCAFVHGTSMCVYICACVHVHMCFGRLPLFLSGIGLYKASAYISPTAKGYA